MRKEITLGQLLSVGVTLLIAIVTGWVTLNNRVSTQGAEIKNLQERSERQERTFEKIDLKLEKIIDKLDTKKDK